MVPIKGLNLRSWGDDKFYVRYKESYSNKNYPENTRKVEIYLKSALNKLKGENHDSKN